MQIDTRRRYFGHVPDGVRGSVVGLDRPRRPVENVKVDGAEFLYSPPSNLLGCHLVPRCRGLPAGFSPTLVHFGEAFPRSRRYSVLRCFTIHARAEHGE